MVLDNAFFDYRPLSIAGNDHRRTSMALWKAQFSRSPCKLEPSNARADGANSNSGNVQFFALATSDACLDANLRHDI
jgi:hypothetical protein